MLNLSSLVCQLHQQLWPYQGVLHRCLTRLSRSWRPLQQPGFGIIPQPRIAVPSKEWYSLVKLTTQWQISLYILAHLSLAKFTKHQKKKNQKKINQAPQNSYSFLCKLSHIYPCIKQKESPCSVNFPKKINHFSPSLDHLSDLHWWKCFLPAYHLISSSPWINRSTHFCTDVGFTGIGCLFKSHFFHSTCLPFIDLASLSIFLLKMWTITM